MINNHYVILSGKSIAELETKVNDHLNRDYYLVGILFYTQTEYLYVQAVNKVEVVGSEHSKSVAEYVG
jgi:hypothetical protein